MKCQSLFSGKIRKNISKYHLLKFLTRMLSIKTYIHEHEYFSSLRVKNFVLNKNIS